MFLPYFSLSFVLHFAAGHPRKSLGMLLFGLLLWYGLSLRGWI